MLLIRDNIINSKLSYIRIFIPVTLTVLLFIAARFMIFIPAVEKDLIEQKKLMISELVYSVYNVVEYFHDLELQGLLSTCDAKEQALEQVRKIRYGPENKDYFWINDLYPNMIMHPYTPYLENTSLVDYKDPNGKKLFVEFVRKVEAEGEGYVDYIWQWKDNSEKLVPKLSFVKGFKPWEWIIGTGIYLEDVDKEIDNIIKKQNYSALVIVLFMSIISLFVIKQNLGLERKHQAANEQLAVSENKYKTIFENTGSAMALIENDMTISLINSEFEILSGLSKEDIENKLSFPDFFEQEYVEEMIDFHRLRRTDPGLAPEKYESLFIDKDSNLKNVWLTVEMIPNTDKSILSILDITQRKKSEKALQYRLDIEKLLTNISTYFVTLSDEELDSGLNYALRSIGRFTKVDRSYIFLTSENGKNVNNTHEWCTKGIESQRNNLKNISIDSIPWWFKNLENHGIIYAPVVHNLPLDAKKEKNMLLDKGIKSVLAVPLFNGNELMGFMGFDSVKEYKYWKNEDIDLLKAISEIIAKAIQQKKTEEEKLKLEAQLFHAQKMESIGRLAGGIAHDFNNILTSTMGYAELLKMKFDDLSTIEGQAVDVILSGSQKAGHLTKQLLSFSRNDLYRPASLDINNLLKDCVKVSEKIFDKSIEINFILDPKLKRVMADQNQIDQVFTNLLINARDAMPDKGEITISTENFETDFGDSELPADLKSGNYVKIIIKDSGIGIPENIQEKIFEPFFTTKAVGKGTGLGLSMVYGIIKKHNGLIMVESKPSSGTAFTIYLPVSKKNPPVSNEKQTLYKGNSTLLVVDDEANQRSLSKSLLTQLGYKVLTAGNGREATEVYKGNKNNIDLIILDLIMPDMSGKEAFEEMKRINPNVKVILMSGYSQNGKAEEAINLGAIDFLQKPFRLHEISKAIRKALSN